MRSLGHHDMQTDQTSLTFSMDVDGQQYTTGQEAASRYAIAALSMLEDPQQVEKEQMTPPSARRTRSRSRARSRTSSHVRKAVSGQGTSGSHLSPNRPLRWSGSHGNRPTPQESNDAKTIAKLYAQLEYAAQTLRSVQSFLEVVPTPDTPRAESLRQVVATTLSDLDLIGELPRSAYKCGRCDLQDVHCDKLIPACSECSSRVPMPPCIYPSQGQEHLADLGATLGTSR